MIFKIILLLAKSEGKHYTIKSISLDQLENKETVHQKNEHLLVDSTIEAIKSSQVIIKNIN